ncbi:MAG: zinc-binding alcohol dehydrogenase family protein [Myxococcaceae bacterium]
MNPTIPEQMKAAAIDRFGGPEVLKSRTLPVPKPADDEILIRLETAGIGVWDPWLREGGMDEGNTRFPMVLGSDGAGEVVAVGAKAKRFQIGDRVYAYGFPGGFYAEFAKVKEDNAATIPPGVRMDEAGALGADGITALRGLDDELELQPSQRLLIFGASGGIGHIAVQLAKRMGAEVLAVASGEDGVELVETLGADAVIDGHHDDFVKAVRDFAPSGFDAALILAGNDKLDEALKSMKKGGRVAFPNGVEPEPKVPAGVERHAYDGTPDAKAFARLNELIGDQPFRIELNRVYSLDEVAQAHREVEKHHVGKLAVRLH